MGFEPTTASLEGWNSTTELRPHICHNSELIIHKWVIYHVSYFGGQARIRTLEADGSRFTVCPRCPLGYLPVIIS